MRFGPSGETIFGGALASSWGAGKCFCSFLEFFEILAENLVGRKCRWEKSGREEAQKDAKGRVGPGLDFRLRLRRGTGQRGRGAWVRPRRLGLENV